MPAVVQRKFRTIFRDFDPNMLNRFPDAMRKGKVIGRSLLRLEDEPLLLGQGRFADDISFPDQLHMRVVRSQHAHGRVIAIDIASARAVPGVVAVWTGADIKDLPPIDFRDPAAEALKPYRQPALAQDMVRYVGEPVAAVFAERSLCRRGRRRAGTRSKLKDCRPLVMDADAPPAAFAVASRPSR